MAANKVVAIDHPLIGHLLGLMRDKECPHAPYRQFMNQISLLMTYEALALTELPARQVAVDTQLRKNVPVNFIASERMALVAIMRAALPMAAAANTLLPRAPFGHIGIQRNPDKTLDLYFERLPKLEGVTCLVFDPVIATGQTASLALDRVKAKRGSLEGVTFVNLVCTRAGVSHIQENHPDVLLVTAAIDDEMSADGFVIPGLGDAGDRIFGTDGNP